MRHPPSRLMLSLFFAIVLVATVFTSANAKGPIPRRNASEFEIRFTKDMMDHHRLAIAEAETCLDKAISELLRHRCQLIITSGSQQIQLMQSWLQNWYGIDYQPTRSAAGLRRLGKLEGAVFEMKLMDVIIRHNRQVVRVTGKCIERAYHAELLTLCRNIEAAQTAQIDKLQLWLCEWWLVCRKYN